MNDMTDGKPSTENGDGKNNADTRENANTKRGVKETIPPGLT